MAPLLPTKCHIHQSCSNAQLLCPSFAPLRHHSRPARRARRACAALPKPGDVDKGFSVLEWTGKLVPQGQLVTGVKFGWRLAWQTMVKELAPQSKEGAYKRPNYTFSGRIGTQQFPAESGRYHLYLGNACPWCHRVSLVLVLRGLACHISITKLVDDPEKASRGGWIMDKPEPVFGAKDLWQVYEAASPGYTGRCTAPLLLDKRTKRIVCNESADIMRMLNSLHLPGSTDVDLLPPSRLPEIDALNDLVYDAVNNGVYKSGFATSQAAYDNAQKALYDCLDSLEQRLATQRFLLGDRLTEADLRLYPTVIRFDAMYSCLFKCSRKRIADYPNLTGWMRDVYQLQVEGSSLQVADTFDMDAGRQSYYSSLFPLNPSGIVPAGPTLADAKLGEAHNREKLSSATEIYFQRSSKPEPKPAAAAAS